MKTRFYAMCQNDIDQWQDLKEFNSYQEYRDWLSFLDSSNKEFYKEFYVRTERDCEHFQK